MATGKSCRCQQHSYLSTPIKHPHPEHYHVKIFENFLKHIDKRCLGRKQKHMYVLIHDCSALVEAEKETDEDGGS